jgi:hypothetical protein
MLASDRQALLTGLGRGADGEDAGHTCRGCPLDDAGYVSSQLLVGQVSVGVVEVCHEGNRQANRQANRSLEQL